MPQTGWPKLLAGPSCWGAAFHLSALHPMRRMESLCKVVTSSPSDSLDNAWSLPKNVYMEATTSASLGIHIGTFHAGHQKTVRTTPLAGFDFLSWLDPFWGWHTWFHCIWFRLLQIIILCSGLSISLVCWQDNGGHLHCTCDTLQSTKHSSGWKNIINSR